MTCSVCDAGRICAEDDLNSDVAPGWRAKKKVKDNAREEADAHRLKRCPFTLPHPYPFA